MTTQGIENTVQQAINTVLLNNNPSPPENNEYRFYHCHLVWNGLKCKKVDGPSTMPTDEWTKLMFVKTYIPERLDRHILKYQWLPDRVIIEEKST
jgi:hypothetical protein